MNHISVIILTRDEEADLPACLESLESVAGEVFVVDSGSTDQTVSIAKAMGAKVVEHPFSGYAVQRNWAQENLPLATGWVLHLDADERLTPELATEIGRAVEAAPSDVDGFLLRRRTVFLGRSIRHGGHYPSYQLRLFRRGRAFCENRRYDQHFVAAGKVARLEHDYVNVVGSNLTAWIGRHVRWAELEAQELAAASVNEEHVQAALFGNPIQRRRWLKHNIYLRAPLFARSFFYWFYRYFVRLGFLDGKEGLIFHFLQGFWYRFLVDTLLWRTRSCVPRRDSSRRLARGLDTTS